MVKSETPLLNMISASLIVVTRFVERLKEIQAEQEYTVPSEPAGPARTATASAPPARVSPTLPEPVGERHKRAIPQNVKIAVSARDGGRCRQCGSTHELHFDHVIPLSRGGTNSVANIQLLCGVCNRAKGAKWSGDRSVR
jgi:HNH endonuclease